MHRGVRWSILGVIFEARVTHKCQKNSFCWHGFFYLFFGVEKVGVGPRREWLELAFGPLKEVII